MTGLAVITGTGGGLGRALAVELVRRGVAVVGFGRNAGPLEETARIAGPGFWPMVVDVSDPNAVAAAFAALPAPVTILINNAAVYPRRDILDETAGSFMDTVAVNLGGVVACTDAALRQMVLAGMGRIMNVSTFADLAPHPTTAAYAVSKGAARIYTRALVVDLADRFPQIVINDWVPGALATGMGVQDGLDPAIAARWGAQLALWHDPSLTGTVFQRDHEQLPPRSLMGRVRNMVLLGHGRKARQLG